MIIYFFIKASENGHLETVNYLIENGADIKKEDKNGETALFRGN